MALLAGVARAANAEATPAPADASAEPPREHVARFALVLNEPRAALDECGGSAALQASVERRLAREVFIDEAMADASLVISVDRMSEALWQAHISERDRTGTEVGHREVAIDADDCKKGIETLAILLAIMVGPPRMVAAPPASGPEPAVTPEPEPEAEPRHPLTKAPERPPVATKPAEAVRPRWSFAPEVAMLAGSGVLPAVSWGVEGGVAVSPPVDRFSFIARAQLWPSRAAGTTPEVDISRFAAGLLACRRMVRVETASLALCTGLSGGWLSASAPSIISSSKGTTRTLFDVPFEARGSLDLGSFARGIRVEAVLAAQLAVLLQRDQFTFENRMGREVPLFRPAPVAFASSLGVAVHFF